MQRCKSRRPRETSASGSTSRTRSPAELAFTDDPKAQLSAVSKDKKVSAPRTGTAPLAAWEIKCRW